MQRDLDEVELLLDMWAAFMRIKKYPVDGYPSESNCFINSWKKDFEELCEGADANLLASVDAAYDSLSTRFQAPILCYYGLGSNVWRVKPPASFEEAKIEIRKKFVERGLL